MRVEMPAVQRLEPASLVVLAPEQLHDAHPRDPLLKRRVDPGQPRTDVTVRHAHALLEQVRREIDERDHGERGERQSPVRDHHHHRDREEREHIAESRHHACREQLVERFDVRRHPRHEPSHRRAVVEPDRQPLHVLEQLLPEIAHHALAEQRRQHRFPVRAAEADEERRCVEHRRSPREPGIARRQRDVDHTLRHHRSDELQQAVGHQQREGAEDERAIRPHVHEQSSDEPAVVSLACLEVLVARVRRKRGGHGPRKLRTRKARRER